MAVMDCCRTVGKAEALAAQMQGGAQAISLDQLSSGMLIAQMPAPAPASLT